jgi:hypothetical protein
MKIGLQQFSHFLQTASVQFFNNLLLHQQFSKSLLKSYFRIQGTGITNCFRENKIYQSSQYSEFLPFVTSGESPTYITQKKKDR